MAPPNNRRPGHSRRAQYTTFLGYVLAFAGALVGGAMLLVSTGNASAFSGLRSAANDAAAPGAKLAAGGRTGSQGFYETIAGYFTKGSHVASLEREVAEARVTLAETAAVREENRRLKALLGIVESDPRPIAVARLIGSTSSSSRRFAILGAGSSQGVAVGMPVRSPLGLVGRVLETGRSAARILLVTDTQSIVPVRRASDGVTAFAYGRGDGTIVLKLSTFGPNPLKPGDAFVTSGSGGLFRPGIAVAVVASLTRTGAIAYPLADPGSTEFVTVEEAWSEAAREADLPPAAGSDAAQADED
jgi:rod shape-determining protein MreC